MLGKGKNKKATKTDTLIGPQTELAGDIKFSNALRIEGTVKGNVIAENDGNSLIQLSENGTIEGEVRAPFVELNGVVIGDVHGGEHVELASKARVAGNVYYNLMEMAVGAEVNGKLVHTQVLDDVPLALGHVEPLDEPDLDIE